jgi:hypothetical protein
MRDSCPAHATQLYVPTSLPTSLTWSFIYLFPLLFSSTFDTHTLIQQLKYTLKPTNPTHQTINMSAPNANAPNEGIVGQVTNSISVCPSSLLASLELR